MDARNRGFHEIEPSNESIVFPPLAGFVPIKNTICMEIIVAYKNEHGASLLCDKANEAPLQVII